MKPLVTLQKVLTWLCICPADENTSKLKKTIYVAFSIIVPVTLLCQVLASATFVWKFLSIDFEKSLHALHPVMGWSPLLYTFIIFIILRHRIVALFSELSKIYDECGDRKKFEYLEQANNKCERGWKIYFKYVMGGFGGSCVISYLESAVRVTIMHEPFDTDNLYSQFKIVLPWNQSTPLGYFAEGFYSAFACQIYLILNGAIVLLFISLSLHHQAFYRIFNYLTLNLDDSGPVQSDVNKLCEIINFHIRVKGWFLETANVLTFIILVFMMAIMLAVSCIVFEVDLKLKHPDSELVLGIISCTIAIANLFVFCYFGKLATDSFGKMANCLYESNWQRLPINLQKYLILMIGNTQQPLYYQGFGVFIVDLVGFTKLMKAVFTYYMLLKTISSY